MRQVNGVRKRVRTQPLRNSDGGTGMQPEDIHRRRLWDTLSIGVAAVDGELRLRYINNAFARMLGRTRAEMLGRPLCDFMQSGGRSSDADTAPGAEEMGCAGARVMRLLHADGRVRAFLVSRGALHKTDRIPDGVHLTFTDVTPLVSRCEKMRSAVHEHERVLTAIAGGVWKWWPTAGRLEFTERYYTMVGYRPGDFPATYDAWLALIHPDDRDATLQRSMEFIRSGVDEYRNEFRIRARSGEYRNMLALGRVVERDETGNVLCVIGHHVDITSQMRERAHDAHFAYMLDNAPDSITVHDCSGRFLYANRRTFELHGYTEKEFMAMRIQDLDDPQSAALIPERIAQVFRDGRAEFTVRHRHRDGHYIPLHVSVRPIQWEGTAAIFSVAVDRTRIEAAERERIILATAVEQAQDIVVIADPDGNISYVNRKFCEVTGYSSSEVLGRNPRILKSGSHDAAFYRRLWNTLLAGNTWRGELINKKKSGELYTEEATISPVVDAGGELLCYVAVKRDITEFQKLRAESQSLHERLRHYQKMESIGRMAGGLAHDFNNTLQTVRTYCDVLRTRPMPPETLHLLDGISSAVDTSAALTRKLLDISRRRPMSVRPIPIARHVLKICSLFRDTAPETINFRHVLSPDAGEITLDPVQLDQLLMNLLTNARDAVAGRPDPCITLTLCTETLPAPLHALFETIPEGEYLVLSVRDNGPGIPPDRLRDVFEPFVTTKHGHGGCGLGLATVYGIVRQNGFFINVDGGYGTGATFSVYMSQKPAAADVTVRSDGETASGRMSSDGTGTMHVLLVEDDEVLRALARNMLQSMGHTVTVAESAEDVLRIARDSTTPIDVLMTDVVMPGMHGPELARTIKRSRPDIAVLYVSGYDHHLTERGAPTESREWFLPKPYRAEDLEDVLRRVYAGRQA